MIADRLKKVRTSTGMTQVQFANSLGLTRAAYAKYEYGDVVPKEVVLRQIAHTFNVNKQWLETGTGSMFIPITTEEKRMKFIAELAKNEDEDLQRAMMQLTQLTPERFKIVADLIENLTEEKHP
ncbi:helix-turn-helix domain-containing protein [Bacillus albus]|uniref:helix-turn-helix domain-containing protein n=1 Tax=Bacillus albus TaxID=2026189 RepID=UPI0010222F23|nr:helix-turn-helix transcriptional regulator [Bacillus albus]